MSWEGAHREDRVTCSCGKRHCARCGEVWPCTAEERRRVAAAHTQAELGDR